MFIKVPIYFEIEGPMPLDLGPLQLDLQGFTEKLLIPRGNRLPIDWTLKEKISLGFPDPKAVIASLIKRKIVLDGLR